MDPGNVASLYRTAVMSTGAAASRPTAPMTDPSLQAQQQQINGGGGGAAAAGGRQLWDRPADVMNTYMQTSMGRGAAAAYSPNALGTISASVLRKQQNDASTLGVALPSAPRQPTGPAPPQPQQQQPLQHQPYASPFPQPQYAPIHAGSAQPLAPQPSVAGYPASQGPVQPVHYVPPPQPQPYQHQPPAAAAGGAPVAAAANEPMDQFLVAPSGVPRFVLFYNEHDAQSVNVTNALLTEVQYPHCDLFEWSVTTIPIHRAHEVENGVEALQGIRDNKNFQAVLQSGAVLYDRIRTRAFREHASIVRTILAQKDMWVGWLIANEVERRQNRAAAAANGAHAAAGPAVAMSVDLDAEAAGAGISRAHRGVTEPGGSGGNVSVFARRSVLGGSVQEFQERGEREAAKINFDRSRRAVAGGSGGGNGGGPMRAGHGGDVEGGGGMGTIQQIPCRDRRPAASVAGQ